MCKAPMIAILLLGFFSYLQGQSIPGLPVFPSLDVRDSLEEIGLAIVGLPVYPSIGTDGCNMGCSNPLPLRFLEIAADRLDEERVDVRWETASEVMVQYFEVERSLGNARHFEPAGMLAAISNPATVNKYAIIDPNPYAGISFYRIKEIDRDGVSQYSKTVSVEGYYRSDHLSVFPNPAGGVLGLAIYLREAQNTSIRIYDGVGKIVLHTEEYGNSGMTKKNIGISPLSQGLYTVEMITASQERLTVRFIKK